MQPGRGWKIASRDFISQQKVCQIYGKHSEKTTSDLSLERLNKNYPCKEEDLGQVFAKHREELSKEIMGM